METRNDSGYAYGVLFAQTEPYEMENGKDVCDFTFSELIYMYKMWNLRSDATLMLKNNYLRQYEKWANENGYKNTIESAPNIVTRDITQQCINQSLRKVTMIDRDDLLQLIAPYENPREKFMTLALFEFGKGKAYTDIFYARIEDIDEENHTIKLDSGRTVEISKELIDFAYESYDADMYCTPEGVLVPLTENGTIIKQYRNSNGNPRNGEIIYKGIKKLLKYTDLGKYTSPMHIEKSGMIAFIKRKAAQMNISSEKYLMEHHDVVENQFGKGKIIVKTFLSQYGDFL